MSSHPAWSCSQTDDHPRRTRPITLDLARLASACGRHVFKLLLQAITRTLRRRPHRTRAPTDGRLARGGKGLAARNWGPTTTATSNNKKSLRHNGFCRGKPRPLSALAAPWPHHGTGQNKRFRRSTAWHTKGLRIARAVSDSCRILPLTFRYRGRCDRQQLATAPSMLRWVRRGSDRSRLVGGMCRWITVSKSVGPVDQSHELMSVRDFLCGPAST